MPTATAPDQPRGQPLPAVGGVGAHRADLGPARRAHPLPRHRDERPAAADAQVGAEVEGAGEERAGLGPGDQVEHRGHVRGPEHDGLGVRGRLEPGAVHLDAGDRAAQIPAGRRLGGRAGHDGDAARPDQRGEIVPAGVAAVSGVGDGGERGHVHRIARGAAAALRHVRLGAGQRGPRGVVEGVGHVS